MRNFILILICVILFSSCAPMPGTKLINGISSSSTLAEVEINYHKDNLFATSAKCLSLLNEYERYGIIALTFVANAGLVPACVQPWKDIKTNKITKCDIYYSWDWTLPHEERHCMGYDDVLY